MKKLFASLGLAAMLLSSIACAKQPDPGGAKNQPGVFDYYALALSWAPNFCADHTDPGECGPGKRFGFMLHGLWPQYANGYPHDCSSAALAPALKAQYGPMFASPDLIDHEWPKHGTCSGLSPLAYLELTSRLKGTLAIPADYQHPDQPVRMTIDEFGKAFKAANPSLADDAVLPFCNGGGRFLQELHACYDKMGVSQACSASEIGRSRSSCGQPSFLLQNVK